MSRVILSRSAELDLDEIDLQTFELFGFDQAEKTAATFEEALRNLTGEPTIGHRRDDLCPPGRDFLFWTVLRRFFIVYQPREDGIWVARIIDGRRDVPSVLGTNPGDEG